MEVKMSSMPVSEAIANAIVGWDGCDWTHEEEDEEGERVLDEDGDPRYCDGESETCAYCRKAAEAAHEAERLGHEATTAVEAGDMALALTLVEAAHGLEMDYADAPAWDPALKLVTKASEMVDPVIVEVMPEHLRASHEAAGNSGVYPHNGSERSILGREEAGDMVGDDPEWVSIVRAVRPDDWSEYPLHGA